MKSKIERSYEVGKELKGLWQKKLNFPHISDKHMKETVYDVQDV